MPESTPAPSPSTSCSGKREKFSSTITYTYSPRWHRSKKISREIRPEREGSVPEPAAPSSCHRGDAPGSAGPLSSATTATEPREDGQGPRLAGLALHHVWRARSEGLICADKGIYSTLEPRALLQGLGLGSCLSTLSSH